MEAARFGGFGGGSAKKPLKKTNTNELGDRSTELMSSPRKPAPAGFAPADDTLIIGYASICAEVHDLNDVYIWQYAVNNSGFLGRRFTGEQLLARYRVLSAQRAPERNGHATTATTTTTTATTSDTAVSSPSGANGANDEIVLRDEARAMLDALHMPKETRPWLNSVALLAAMNLDGNLEGVSVEALKETVERLAGLFEPTQGLGHVRDLALHYAAMGLTVASSASAAVQLLAHEVSAEHAAAAGDAADVRLQALTAKRNAARELNEDAKRQVRRLSSMLASAKALEKVSALAQKEADEAVENDARLPVGNMSMEEAVQCKQLASLARVAKVATVPVRDIEAATLIFRIMNNVNGNARLAMEHKPRRGAFMVDGECVVYVSPDDKKYYVEVCDHMSAKSLSRLHDDLARAGLSTSWTYDPALDSRASFSARRKTLAAARIKLFAKGDKGYELIARTSSGSNSASSTASTTAVKRSLDAKAESPPTPKRKRSSSSAAAAAAPAAAPAAATAPSPATARSPSRSPKPASKLANKAVASPGKKKRVSSASAPPFASSGLQLRREPARTPVGESASAAAPKAREAEEWRVYSHAVGEQHRELWPSLKKQGWKWSWDPDPLRGTVDVFVAPNTNKLESKLGATRFEGKEALLEFFGVKLKVHKPGTREAARQQRATAAPAN